MRVASCILIGLIGLSVGACQTQTASVATPGPASRQACVAKAQQEVPDTGQRSSDLQRDRYYIYRACMHAAGLKL
jgi:hypothetical protein